MISNTLFRGRLIRLSSAEPEPFGKLLARWGRDSAYLRQLDTDPAVLFSSKQITAWNEKDEHDDMAYGHEFQINTLEDDRCIGFVGLFMPFPQHRDAWVGIGIGEPEYRGRGYGTEAMRLVLRYAFDELNMHRVTLGVFAYNGRAIRSYEKAGFKPEGLERGAILRYGLRANVLYMGILRSEFVYAE